MRRVIFLLCAVLLLLVSASPVQFAHAAATAKKPQKKEAAVASDSSVFALSKEEKKAKATRAKKRASKATSKANKESSAETSASTRVKAADRANKRTKALREARQKSRAKVATDAAKKVNTKLRKQEIAADPQVQAEGVEKLAWLVEASQATSSGIISMNSEQYYEYVNGGPRPYYLFLAYTARRPENKCFMCRLTHDAYTKLAASYKIGQAHLAQEMISALGAGSYDATKPVFFVELDISKAQDVFNTLRMQSAPTIVVLPPKLTNTASKASTLIEKLPGKYKYQVMQQEQHTHDYQAFVNKLTGVDIQIVEPIPWAFLFMLVVGGISATVAAYFYLDQVLPHLRKQKKGLLICCIVFYLFCISGGMFNIIRQTQFSVTDRDGNEKYIADGVRNQYGAEGYLMGVIEIACGLLLIGLQISAFEPVKGTMDKLSATLRAAPLAGAFIFFWYQLVKIYTQKNWSYHMGFVL